jgi:hypothetical protein
MREIYVKIWLLEGLRKCISLCKHLHGMLTTIAYSEVSSNDGEVLAIVDGSEVLDRVSWGLMYMK